MYFCVWINSNTKNVRNNHGNVLHSAHATVSLFSRPSESDLNHCVFVHQVKSLVFDQSGTYLAVGGSDIRVYVCKQWSEVLNFTGEGKKTLFILSTCHMALMSKYIFDLVCLSNHRPHRTGDWSGLW